MPERERERDEGRPADEETRVLLLTLAPDVFASVFGLLNDRKGRRWKRAVFHG